MELYQLYKLDDLPNFFIKELKRLEPSIDPNLSFQNKKYIKQLSTEFKNDLKIFLENVLKKEEVIISEGWINYIKYNNTPNWLDWHNEMGLGPHKENNVVDDPYMCIIWIQGDKNSGGEFKYIHDETNEINVVSFEPPSLMVMKRETIHSVDHYSSENYRISLNLNFR
jgi:hypothetical protein